MRSLPHPPLLWDYTCQSVQTLPWVAADCKMQLSKWSSWAPITNVTFREELQQRKFPACCTGALPLLCDRNVIVLTPLLILLEGFESLYNGASIIVKQTLDSSANTKTMLSLRWMKGSKIFPLSLHLSSIKHRKYRGCLPKAASPNYFTQNEIPSAWAASEVGGIPSKSSMDS